MKKFFYPVFLLFFYFPLNAQYYYRDILLTNQSTGQFNLYKNAGIKKITIESFDSRDPQVPAITATQKLDNAYRQMVSNTNSIIGGSSELSVSYAANGRPMVSTDTTEGFRSVTRYTYDSTNRLVSLQNTSYSPGGVTDEEIHQWKYDEYGAPDTLYKIRNKTDTTVITFELDEEGRIGEEKAVRNGKQLPSIYYYYDEAHRITDIVRYNDKARRLLPDFMFEYNNAGKLSAMIVIPEGSSNYQRWEYEYNTKGLKTRDRCFDKQRQLMAFVNYRYE